ncbi:ArsB/NhaD family transporter [Microaerobacter geothermalis]|uniref:ArsB/NhaD family transporter n=1 Tax=Microaerobacter geothermalis TaxID=674972 RepID=UPI001F2DFD0C|nr:ArsB/NhaD family transporter [Microaerobacter geothermalis]MCF6092754.1 ArsB/NhaD family transporter [Microaerobacter geothermalis]
MEQTVTEISSLQVYIAIGIFLATYAFIITEKINRAVVALLGAVIMVALGIVELEAAFVEYIEWGTITLLIGMMILVGITNKTGVFQYMAIKSAKLAKGDPIRILIALSILTAVASAFLDNVTTVLLIVPVTFSITRMLGVNPIPFLISEVLASNIGGTATLIGDPPNIMIGAAKGNEHLTFNAFLYNLTPVVVVILAVTLWMLYLIYRKQMKVSDEKKAEIMALNERDYIKDPALMKKSVSVLGLTILGFILHSAVNMEPATVAMAGATLLMLIGVKEHDLEEVFHSVEWVTIFFFAGLFTLIGGLEHVGVIKALAMQALEITGDNIPFAALLILWVSGIASATIDNIPFVATMIPLIQDMGLGMGLPLDSPILAVLWWSLALGADIGGNGTLIGASANVIVAGMAMREGKNISYLAFLKIGAPLTLVALIISTVYIYFRYLIPLM